VWVSPPGGSQIRQPYAWWLEAFLNGGGLPAEVRNRGAEAQKITKALCNWDTEVQQWSPDVVVLNYGQYDAMPGLLPRLLERHAVGWHKHPGPVRNIYYDRIVRPSWTVMAGLQRKADRALDPAPFRTPPHRIAAELETVIRKIRLVGAPLVIVMDTWPLSTRWREWFPGMDRRCTAVRESITRTVEAFASPDVRLFQLSRMVSTFDLDDALPDGVHFSAELHRAVAFELSDLIFAWAETQPHLQFQSERRDGALAHRSEAATSTDRG
jgi:hypothetical protein